jgi:precorrin isomerase
MIYLKDPAEIYRASFAAIEREVDLSDFPESLHKIVQRLVHAVAIPEIVEDIAWDGDVAEAASSALTAGAPIIADANMVAAGIMKDRLPKDVEILCSLRDDAVPELAESLATTRSAAAVELWKPHLEGAIVAIGNAPTALFHLIDMLAEGDCPRPAAIFAFPVGFIGAAESKVYLIEKNLGIPFITLQGRKGGSALAAAAVNAVLLGGDA